MGNLPPVPQGPGARADAVAALPAEGPLPRLLVEPGLAREGAFRGGLLLAAGAGLRRVA